MQFNAVHAKRVTITPKDLEIAFHNVEHLGAYYNIIKEYGGRKRSRGGLEHEEPDNCWVMLKARKRGEKEGCFDILGEKVAREIAQAAAKAKAIADKAAARQAKRDA
jgi:hypothetical protein